MENLKNKFNNWEPTPPLNAWANISDALDKDEEYILLQKMRPYSAQPSLSIWESIAEELEEEKHTPVVPINKNYKKLFAYSGIAAAVLVIVFLTSLLFNQQRVSKKFATQAVVNPQENITANNPATADTSKNYSLAYESQNSTPNITRTNNLYKRASYSNKPEVEAISTIQPTPANNLDVVIRQTDNDIDYSYLDRYIVNATNSGEAVKLSKKVYSTFACSQYINEELCKQKIAYLQQKAALSAMTASADFAGVLEIISNFQE